MIETATIPACRLLDAAIGEHVFNLDVRPVIKDAHAFKFGAVYLRGNKYARPGDYYYIHQDHTKDGTRTELEYYSISIMSAWTAAMKIKPRATVYISLNDNPDFCQVQIAGHTNIAPTSKAALAISRAILLYLGITQLEHYPSPEGRT